MIVDLPNSYWIYVLPSDSAFPVEYQGEKLSKDEYLEHFGKWVVMGTRVHLDGLAKELDPYVEEREIHSMKYTRDAEEIFDLDECVLCIYCDDREREDLWQILKKHGVSQKSWVYEREVYEMWSPEGIMLEKCLVAEGLKKGSPEYEKKVAAVKHAQEIWLEGQFGTGKKARDFKHKGYWSFEHMINESL